MKKFEYSPLGKELKSQTGIVKKQYQKLDDNFEFYKIMQNEEPKIKKYRSNLIYDSKYSFHPYYNINNFPSLFISHQNIKFSSRNFLHKKDAQRKKGWAW